MSRQQKGMRILWIVLGFIMLAGAIVLLILALMQAQESARTSKENQGYVRYLACVTEIRNTTGVIAVSKAVSDRCWSTAEKQVGIKLNRYSESEVQSVLGR